MSPLDPTRYVLFFDFLPRPFLLFHKCRRLIVHSIAFLLSLIELHGQDVLDPCCLRVLLARP